MKLKKISFWSRDKTLGQMILWEKNNPESNFRPIQSSLYSTESPFFARNPKSNYSCNDLSQLDNGPARINYQ